MSSVLKTYVCNGALFSVHSKCCISFCWQYFTKVCDQTHKSMQLLYAVQVGCNLFWLIVRATFLLKIEYALLSSMLPLTMTSFAQTVSCSLVKYWIQYKVHLGVHLKRCGQKSIHTHAGWLKKARFNEFRRSWCDFIAIDSAKSSIVHADEYDNNGWRFAWLFS